MMIRQLIVVAFWICAVGWSSTAVAESVEPKAWYSVNSPWQTFEALNAAVERIKSIACPVGRFNCATSHSGTIYTDPYWLHQMETRYQLRKPDGTLGEVNVDRSKGVLIWFECPIGFAKTVSNSNVAASCKRTDPITPPCFPCVDSNAVHAVGNPIFLATGMKQQIEIDYENASGTLRFVRTYRSDERSWQHNYASFATDMNRRSASSKVADNSCFKGRTDSGYWGCFEYAPRNLPNDAVVRRGNGRLLLFGNSSDLKPAADVNDRVASLLDSSGQFAGLQVTNGDTDAIEVYDGKGRIISSRTRSGLTTTFAYSTSGTPPEIAQKEGLLISVTDSFGHALAFTYDGGGRLKTMTDPAGGLYQYYYDTNGLFSKVIYPDSKQRQYLYGEAGNSSGANAPYLLTGIIDENNVRYATYKYDSSNRAFSTEHAGGVEKYVATYGQRAVVVDPLGTSRSHGNTWKISVYLADYTSQPDLVLGGTNTNSNTLTYDANGNVSTIKHFDNTTTSYTFDLNRNLETKRVEGSGSSVARTISTEWHPTFRLPARIAEPKRITSNTYDDNGNLLTRTVRATTDANGASGFSATLAGTPQTWTYTYDSFGRVLTAKGPRADVASTTTYTYDTEGNLATQTNAAGHVTTFSNYDKNGRVGRITDPNGLITDLSYKPRGWLSAITVGGETTSYEYDGVGQVKQVTLPDSSVLYYAYDDAHRLTTITDTLGNSISYTLDNMGNRTGEKTKDANGVLARQVTRVIDALNRVKQVTGAL